MAENDYAKAVLVTTDWLDEKRELTTDPPHVQPSSPRRATRPTYSARLRRSVRGAYVLGLETRGLDTLTREKKVDRFAVNA
jgi:hypothetical protein